MTVALASVAILVLYGYGVGRYRMKYPDRAFPLWRVAAFAAGVAIIAFALSPWSDALADRSFAAHMSQHIALMLIAAPLLLMGAPLLLLVSVPPTRTARSIVAWAENPLVRVVFAPLTGWLVFVGLLWVAHFSPLYEAALEHPAIHVFEHAAFLTAALLFWMPVVQAGYTPQPVAFPARMLYLVLMFPQGAFLGLAIYSARAVLYPHYLLTQSFASALVDQQNGGAIMWIAGGFIMFVAFMLTVGAWAYSEREVDGASTVLSRGSTGSP
ncbi:MAG TPA: cytochrome c oxidase assembly protein [Candidatus Rubrimentiphilum sp.]|nr:cytochrome c oxidase assembly protein [Candidatus Rubrimentiphilum sp.]